MRREFSIRERVKLAMQADAFNINNAVHFGAPGTNIDQRGVRHGLYHGQQPAKVAVQRKGILLIRSRSSVWSAA